MICTIYPELFSEAERLYKQLADIAMEYEDTRREANAYWTELGNIACWRDDYDTAKEYLKEALKIFVRLGDDNSVEITKRNIIRLEELCDISNN